MYQKEYYNEIPEVFKKRGGTDGRRPTSAVTTEMLVFVDSDSLYCMLTYDDTVEAKKARNTANEYAKKHKIGCRCIQRENYLLFIKESATAGENEC